MTIRHETARFAMTFALLVVLFSMGLRTQFFDENVRAPSLATNAALSAALLRALGEDASATRNHVDSSRFGISIWDGCDALEPLGLFAAAVAATPVPLGLRLLGIISGALLLLLINQLRIVSLYFTGIYFPRAFEALHVEVWQVLFVLLGIGIWMIWSQWTIRVQADRV
jgi:exosortase/archaeosortase family protein